MGNTTSLFREDLEKIFLATDILIIYLIRMTLKPQKKQG